ncbi:MAG: hypothetical protein ACTHN5_09770 [Phycisphaerae bacterium]
MPVTSGMPMSEMMRSKADFSAASMAAAAVLQGNENQAYWHFTQCAVFL